MRIPARLRHVTLWLRISAVLTLVALALIVWSVLEPTPLPVMIAMTVGQGVGTLALLIFVIVVFKDLTRSHRARPESLQQLGVTRQTQRLPRAARDSLQAFALTRDD
jgi:hypothetical protein